MILRVSRRAARCRGIDRVVVATDDRRIQAVVEEGGGEAVMTAGTHRTGTSRVAEIAHIFKYGIVLNIQGDEPLLPVRGVERLIEAMIADRNVPM